MPYPGIDPKDVPKVERCVEQVMAKGKPKDRAIAICVSAIKGNGSLLNLQAATDEDILALQAQLAESPGILAQASLPTNAILKVTGACLARSEINLNGDGITDEGIKQLADTIRLMPLTEDHDKEPRGVFTKGYVSEDGTECLVDLFVWAGHFEKFASEIQSGVRKLSMDAEAGLAICSVCGTAFTTTAGYCDHIRHRQEGAVRWLYDLTAVAGGAVKHPAGTGTVFPGKEGFTVISHKVQAGLETTAEWWRKFWKTEGDIPTGKFADKKNRKYPFLNPDGAPDPDGWMAAWKYAHKYKESAVIAVLKRHLPKGYKLEGDSVTSTGGAKVKVLCPECGHEHEIETKAEELQAELNAKLTELQTAQTDAQNAKGDAAGLQVQLDTEKRTTERFVELAVEAGLEVAKEALPSLRTADEEVFKTLKTMASRLKVVDKPELPKPPQQVIAADTGAPDTSDTWKLEL